MSWRLQSDLDRTLLFTRSPAAGGERVTCPGPPCPCSCPGPWGWHTMEGHDHSRAASTTFCKIENWKEVAYDLMAWSVYKASVNITQQGPFLWAFTTLLGRGWIPTLAHRCMDGPCVVNYLYHWEDHPGLRCLGNGAHSTNPGSSPQEFLPALCRKLNKSTTLFPSSIWGRCLENAAFLCVSDSAGVLSSVSDGSKLLRGAGVVPALLGRPPSCFCLASPVCLLRILTGRAWGLWILPRGSLGSWEFPCFRVSQVWGWRSHLRGPAQALQNLESRLLPCSSALLLRLPTFSRRAPNSVLPSSPLSQSRLTPKPAFTLQICISTVAKKILPPLNKYLTIKFHTPLGNPLGRQRSPGDSYDGMKAKAWGRLHTRFIWCCVIIFCIRLPPRQSCRTLPDLSETVWVPPICPCHINVNQINQSPCLQPQSFLGRNPGPLAAGILHSGPLGGARASGLPCRAQAPQAPKHTSSPSPGGLTSQIIFRFTQSNFPKSETDF